MVLRGNSQGHLAPYLLCGAASILEPVIKLIGHIASLAGFQMWKVGGGFLLLLSLLLTLESFQEVFVKS